MAGHIITSQKAAKPKPRNPSISIFSVPNAYTIRYMDAMNAIDVAKIFTAAAAQRYYCRQCLR